MPHVGGIVSGDIRHHYVFYFPPQPTPLMENHMGPDTEQNIKTQVTAATEAVDLLKTEFNNLKSKVQKVADRIDQHITAEERAEAARRETYKKNMYKGE
jgi:FtsZ-binding cell division protein ZapB